MVYKFNSNIVRTGPFKSFYLFVKFLYIFTCITYTTNYCTVTCINTHVKRDSMTNNYRSIFLKKSNRTFQFLILCINVFTIIQTLLEDFNSEEIKGSFYSFELILVANKNLFIIVNCSFSSYLFLVFLIDKLVCLSIANRFVPWNA